MGDTKGDEEIAGSSSEYHWGSGCKTKAVLELSDIFLGSSTAGFGSGSGTGAGLDSDCFLGFASFFGFLSCFPLDD